MNELVSESLDESQAFRIDHYLGKETVQNILVLRYANSIFEPVWNRKYIDYVEITAAETLGVEQRGSFYDKTGVMRDIVQNHLLQVLALSAMEAPVSFAADDVRSEKVKVLRSLRPITRAAVSRDVALGQYQGYRQEKGVAAESRTPTYAAMKVFIDNWRWQGVPFYLRAGKKLASHLTEIAVHFQSVPTCLFSGRRAVPKRRPQRPSHPHPARRGHLPSVRRQGARRSFVPRQRADEHELRATPSESRSPRRTRGCILDCMRGDATLFARRDEVEEAWKFVTPVLETWEKGANRRRPTRREDRARARRESSRAPQGTSSPGSNASLDSRLSRREKRSRSVLRWALGSLLPEARVRVGRDSAGLADRSLQGEPP